MQLENHKRRIDFIDVMRAYAILMMVQGHLVDALLAPEYRDISYLAYSIWDFMRGITAPVFFFASGAIFKYLLMKQESKGIGFYNPRVIKGFKRTVMLIFLGYALHIFFPIYMIYDFIVAGNFKSFFRVHVLHIIGIAITIIIFIYLITRKNKKFSIIFYFMSGNFVFLIFPFVLDFDWNTLFPYYIANYFTMANGSVFTIVPWVGYSLFGACFGLLVFRYSNLIYEKWFFLGFIIIGIIIQIVFVYFFDILYQLTKIEYFLKMVSFNYLYFRVSHVFIVAGVIGLITLKYKIPKIITTIGSETLAIYFWHSVVIYGSLSTFGLLHLFGRTLNPWQCIIVAVFLEALMILFAVITNKIKLRLRNNKRKKSSV